MSYILYIETSSDICSVCLAKGDSAIAELSAPKAQSHSEKLTLLIDQILKTNDLLPADLSAIGLSIGPGSYTGLRIGSSVARGLSLALDIPILTISSLKAIASIYFDSSSSTIIVPMIDARRDEVYHAVYNSSGDVLVDPAPIIINEHFLTNYTRDPGIQSIVLCGNGTNKPLPLDKESKFQLMPIDLLASHLIPLGHLSYINKQYADRAYFDLDYIKTPNITKSNKNHLNQIPVK